MKKKQFKTKAEVDEYYAGDKIECLLCGKKFKSLAMHLSKVHGWNTDSYKEYYGLPWRRGLSGASTRKKMHEFGKRNLASGKAFGGDFTPYHKLPRPKQRKRAMYRDVMCLENIPKMNRNAIRKQPVMTPEQDDEALAMRRSGEMMLNITRKFGVSRASVHRALDRAIAKEKNGQARPK